MSRSIGDSLGSQVGVIAEAEVAERLLGPEDALLILASDGLWDVWAYKDVLRYPLRATATDAKGKANSGSLDTTSTSTSVTEHLREVCCVTRPAF